MSRLLAGWWHYFALGAVQALPVLLAAWLVDACLARSGRALARRVLWTLVLFELLAPPSVGGLWPALAEDALPLRWLQASASIESGLPSHATPPSWLATLCGMWALGTMVVSLAPWWQQRRLRRWLAQVVRPCSPAVVELADRVARRLRLRTTLDVVLVRDIGGACVVGWWHARVVLDARLCGAIGQDPVARRRLEHALLHEAGHVRRRDGLRGLLLHLLLAPWWFHPTAWLLLRRARLLRELGCDARVRRVLGPEAVDYAQTLVDLAVTPLPPGLRALPALWRQPAEVVQRVRALRPHRASPTNAAAVGAAVVVVLGCSVPFDRAPVVPAGPTFSTTAMLTAPGCLLRRYAVLGALAAESAAAGEATVPIPEVHSR